ncbi:hypothetical protein BGZ51_007308 [Haplosporangium sp. Z 767]|nr:hypothetical protein BGZ50_002485 [Haplosporangium sp. Z 11]KAF9191452.1 hypothetical protein BGZ51_007308 [Haplosporangium sp. Z 767]
MTDKCLGSSPKTNFRNQTDFGFSLKFSDNPNVCIIIKHDLIKSKEKCHQFVPYPCNKIVIDNGESTSTSSIVGPTATLSVFATKTGIQRTDILGPTIFSGPPTTGPAGDSAIGGGGGGSGGSGGRGGDGGSGPTQSGAVPTNGFVSPEPSTAGSSNGAPLGAIIGGALGGLVVLAGLIALIVMLRRKKSRNEYMVRLQSEPDFVTESKDVKQQQQRRLAPGSPGVSPTAATAAAIAAGGGGGGSMVTIDMVERSIRSESAASGVYSMPMQTQAQGQGRKHTQPQIQTAMMSPAPTASRSGSGYTPGRSVVTPIEYTPRSTYISPTSSPVNATAGAAAGTIGSRTMSGSTLGAGTVGQPILSLTPLERQDSERHSGYIDLIPVEETPRIPHSTLGDGSNNMGRSAEEEEYSRIQEEQGLLRSGGASVKDAVGAGKTGQQQQEQGKKVEEDEESEIDEDEIKYL